MVGRTRKGLLALSLVSAVLGDDGLTLHVVVPVGATAVVHVPAADAAAVTEGSVPADEATGVRLLGSGDGVVRYEVGSGDYHFDVKDAA